MLNLLNIILPQLITVFCAVIGSAGFWAFIGRRSENKSALSQMVLGLCHDRIMDLGQRYLDQGWISVDDYGEFRKYYYDPYVKAGGNGSGEKMMREIDKLPNVPPKED